MVWSDLVLSVLHWIICPTENHLLLTPRRLLPTTAASRRSEQCLHDVDMETISQVTLSLVDYAKTSPDAVTKPEVDTRIRLVPLHSWYRYGVIGWAPSHPPASKSGWLSSTCRCTSPEILKSKNAFVFRLTVVYRVTFCLSSWNQQILAVRNRMYRKFFSKLT